MWEPLLSYFTSHPDVEKTGKVKTIYTYLNNSINKLWMLFLHNAISVFDVYNMYFQNTKMATIHKLHPHSQRLLKSVLTYFIKASVIRANAQKLTDIDCSDPENQLSDEDVFIGDDTTAFLLNLTENEGLSANDFYEHVRSFYKAFISKLVSKFDFKSKIFQSLKLLDPSECQNFSLSTFETISKSFAIDFNLGAVKMEFREFAVDSDLQDSNGDAYDAVSFWLRVKSMKTALGDMKYQHLSTLALHLLAISASNADCERVFSLVRRIKTDFRGSLLPETISSLIGVHFNSPFQCCNQTDFPTSFLDKAKSCTREMNANYRTNKEQ